MEQKKGFIWGIASPSRQDPKFKTKLLIILYWNSIIPTLWRPIQSPTTRSSSVGLSEGENRVKRID